jgi:hypothetical protein
MFGPVQGSILLHAVSCMSDIAGLGVNGARRTPFIHGKMGQDGHAHLAPYFHFSGARWTPKEMADNC